MLTNEISLVPYTLPCMSTPVQPSISRKINGSINDIVKNTRCFNKYSTVFLTQCCVKPFHYSTISPFHVKLIPFNLNDKFVSTVNTVKENESVHVQRSS